MIQLHDYQISNYNRIKEIFTYSKFAFNLSEPGSGKSIVGLKIGEEYDHIVVLSYPTVINQNWKPLIEKYNLSDKISTITINGIRGRKNFNSTNIYLKREDFPLERKKVVFTPLEPWLDLCRKRTLILIDEFQMVKNKNIGASAVKVLINTAFEGSAKVLFMSGTPIDNISQIMTYFKLLNIIKRTHKQVILRKLYESEGLDVEINGFNFDEKLLYFFKEIFLDKYSDCMNPFLRKLNGYHSFCTMNESDHEKAVEEFKSLNIICDRILKVGKIEIKDSNFIKQHLSNIEILKVNIIYRIILSQPDKKIVVALSHIDPILKLSKMLSIRHGVIIGNTKNHERQAIIDEFQQPNNNLRIIIANTDIISTGINLDDTDGRFPRLCLVSTNYKTMTFHQLFYRFSRITTKSIPEIKIIFCADLDESRLMQILNTKTEILREFSSSSYYFNDFKKEYI